MNPAITAEWKLDAAQTDPHIGLSLYVPHPEGNNDVILRLGMQDLTPLLPGMFCASYRISSDFSVHGEQHPDCYIFTDNGLEMRARTFDAQNFVEPFAGNYYPIIHEAHVMSVEDNKRMTLLANAPRGAATFGRGEMEVMLHRFELQGFF